MSDTFEVLDLKYNTNPKHCQGEKKVHSRFKKYEGSWEDFARDLRARVQGRPHVFETIPDSPSMQATIKDHLGMIGEMQAWEARQGRPLSPEDGEDVSV